MSEQATIDPAPAAPQPPRRRWVLRWGARRWLRGWGGGRVRLVGYLSGAVAVLLVAALMLWLAPWSDRGQSEPAAKVPVAWTRPAVSADGLAQRSGVTITQVAVTGAGGLVDLRFKVLDPVKAHAVHDPATPPAIVDERSGLVVNRLLMSHSHSGEYQPAVTYYLVFENTNNWVRRGSRVTVLLGNVQVEHVVVA
jgi:hypothetical protein